jgi:hypothetical protein
MFMPAENPALTGLKIRVTHGLSVPSCHFFSLDTVVCEDPLSTIVIRLWCNPASLQALITDSVHLIVSSGFSQLRMTVEIVIKGQKPQVVVASYPKTFLLWANNFI